MAEPPCEAPCGADPWLSRFLEGATAETAILRANGAVTAAAARDRLVRQLLEIVRGFYDEVVDVKEAAELAGVSPETVRRAVRKQKVPDVRTTKRGHHKIRRGDVHRIAGRNNHDYDPDVDAQDIAQRRSKV